ncbi:MAG TPA: CBS domain-containing protein [Rhodospirillales bacterium]|jgi:CBS domain-containing protein|nr:CBS domain-containing protein [Rhodospirillales bacterium]|tara:strand:+ start:571 stop:1017 length:447 start_codon:yes stop_codon:yes gene_type:complete
MQHKIIPDIVLEQKVCELPQGGTVYEAAKEMFEANVAAIVVTDKSGKLVGIVTERDLTRRVLAKGLDAKETRLKEVMTKNPDTLAPDDMVADALELMQKRRYRHLPVAVDGRAVGMVSIRDLYAVMKEMLEKTISETEAFVFGDRYGA